MNTAISEPVSKQTSVKALNNTQYFQGKTVLITGAASGIGKAFAEELYQYGCDVVLVDRNAEALFQLKNELQKSNLGHVYSFVKDLSFKNAAGELYDEIRAQLPKVDVLINNAGFGSLGSFDSIDFATYQEMLQVNVVTMVGLTYKFLPEMLARKDGGIINVSSTAAFQPLSKFSVYAASKSFVLYFTESLYGEYYDKGIKITVVCPGNTKTKFHETARIGKKFIFNLKEPRTVVQKAIKGFLKNEPCVVPSFRDHLLVFLNRLCPRKMTIHMTKNFYK